MIERKTDKMLGVVDRDEVALTSMQTLLQLVAQRRR